MRLFTITEYVDLYEPTLPAIAFDWETVKQGYTDDVADLAATYPDLPCDTASGRFPQLLWDYYFK